ncbi:low-density lipoprotein receptor-related protein 1 isoform X4 [Folsomia candida]|uniref:low-density lipoprotein receptor-related protein 1 isoform X4 n=1 Tax=Folsomia candida TaxID=158441 RepID=UPI0016051510|nr:low-density lipoprotein receptor-related protein 1 isoform X4 [Folsomia candida]
MWTAQTAKWGTFSHSSTVFNIIAFYLIVTAKRVVSFDDSIISPVVDLHEGIDLHLQDSLCLPNQFMCKNGLSCIEKSMVCDSSDDCFDASDEENCPADIPCREGTFQCKYSRKCVPSGWLCDGVSDCGTVPGSLTQTQDMSDEEDERCISDKTCQANQFKCYDGVTCIQIVELCDGEPKCPKKEDEHKYCDNSTICSESGCIYGCKPSPSGEAMCFCPIGQEHDGKSCIESNECLEDGACDQVCELNLHKNKMCSCIDGYRSAGTKCFANDVPDGPRGKPLIFFQDASDIKWIGLNGNKSPSHPQYISPNHTGTLGVDFDHLNDTICWISHSNVSHLMKCGLSSRLDEGWNKPKPYIFSLQDVYHLSFDWISTNIYFVDEALELIFVCNEDVDLCKIIIDSNVAKPRGIALDPMQGYMFFTVWGRSGAKLERSLMDGTSREVIVSKKIVYPHGITLDMPTKVVYWVDKFLDSIERINYDGTNRRTVHRGVQHLQDITVFQNDLYFISMHDNSINKINKYTPSHFSPLVRNLTKPFALKIYHRVRQPRVKHPCMTHYGGNNPCHEFCFPLWKKGKPIAQCGCREGYVLKSNVSCVEEDSTFFMIYVKAHSGVIRSASLKNGVIRKFNNGVMIPVVKKGSYSALGYDYKNRTLYYSDITNFRILKKGMYQADSTIYLDKHIGVVGSIAVDYIGRNLYWVDETIPAIYVSKINSGAVKKLLVHSNLQHPRSLVLSPATGIMYWATLASSAAKSDGSIEKAWMDGSHRETIVQGLGHPIGLTIDQENKYLFWLDTSKFAVQRLLLSNPLQTETLFRINVTVYGEPTGFAYYNGTFYITILGKLMKANISKTIVDADKVELTTISNDEDIAEFLIFDSDFQRGKNKCTSNMCEDLCLAYPERSGSTCACRDGYTLKNDGRTCKVDYKYKSPLECDPGVFKCTNFPKCIPENLICNGRDDCGDNSDEDSKRCDRSYAKQGFCTQSSFHCAGSGLCIPLAYVCDGHSNCPQGDDEHACSNGTIHCSEFEFECKVTKRCIPKSWVCDGSVDCGAMDSSDEHEHCVYPECSELQFKCSNSSSCIPAELICDGIKDCPGNGEDEHPNIDCLTHCNRNRSDTFYCEVDNKCINKTQHCDGMCDCTDARDELNCPGKIQPPECARIAVLVTHDFECDFDVGPLLSKEDCYNVSCGRHSFRCHDGSQCIPLKARCDGTPDCKRDGSDEQNCPKSPIVCNYPSRLCDNGSKCVQISQVCDRKIDCEDKSDEGKRCAEKPCSSVNCSHYCATVPEGYLCHCPDGQHINPLDNSKCMNKSHPCDTFGTCSQLCWKFGTTQYQCLCHPGYALREDGITCSSISNESPYLVFSNRHELRGLYLNSTSIFQSLISNLRNSIALDFFYQNGKYDIFWSDVVDDKIYRGSLVSGSLINIQIVIEKGLATAEGLAVDWIGENIYWVESNLDQIEVARLNGSFRETLISGDMVSPRSIAVDPNYGLLFWSDWQTDDPRIERASMSGKFRKKVFNVGSSGEGAWPNGLTLDYMLKRIYWVDARLDSIHTVMYDGTDYQEVLHDHEALSHPFSITLFESMLVWTDWRSNSVMMANKFHGGNVTTIHKTYTQPFDTKILHQTRQPRKIVNPCGVKNGNCSHLCLLSVNGTHDCGCPHLMTLSSDNRSCITNEKMLLFSRLNEIRAVYYDKVYYHAAPPISYPLIVMPANLHFVSKHKQVYWSDSQSGETKRANIANPTVDTLIDAAAGKPLAMGVDWISNLIFIVVQTSSHNSISVTNLEGQFFSTIIQGKNDLKNVNSLAVNPYKTQIYWPEGITTSDFKIQMASMDGSKRKTLSTSRDNPSLENPASLSYDFTSERLYWINLNTEIIQYYSFHTKEVKKLIFDDMKPHVITVYGNLIFFASEKHDAILKGDKTNGGTFEFVRNYTENIYSIRVYDPEEQNGTNHCDRNFSTSQFCQHLCIPSVGKRICKCALGYTLDEKDQTKCRTIEPVLVFSDSQGIKGISPLPNRTDDLLVPIPLVSFATDIDVDEAAEHLYWLDSEKGKISRIKRDGTEKQTILTDLTAVSGLCIDWIAKNLYWANPKDSYIEVSHLNGSSHHVLITEGLDKPISLALDPARGLLFWADIVKGQVERATLDGLNRKLIAADVKASDVTVDLENQRLYWCTSNDQIESVKYDGTDKKLVYSGSLITSQLHSPIVDKGFLYWVDIGETGGTIMALSVKNFSMVHSVREELGVTIKDLAIFSKGRQMGTNGCAANNGGCEDLCFWNGTVVNCVCAHGKLGSDKKSCESFDAFIAYSRVNSIATAHLTKEITPNDPYPTIQSSEHIRNAIGLAFDYKRNILFYSDVQLGTINSVLFNGSEYGVVAEKQGSVEGLYFEASHSDLYWTCSNDASINRINPHLPNAKVQKLLKLSPNDKPRGIAIDPCESRVYWTNWDSNRPSIQRAYLSGYGIESIIIHDIRMPNSLALDLPARKLYWVDARLDKIERTNLDGTNRIVVIRHNPKHAFSLAVYQDYLIWTDWVRLSVLRANKYTGENVEILRQDIPKPMGIVAVSPQDVVCTTNPCNILNGGCQDICIFNEHKQIVCECGPDKSTLSDGQCVSKSKLEDGELCDGWTCKNGNCVSLTELCNGADNCGDNSDEIGCGINECEKEHNPCFPHHCLDKTIGYECQCLSGYELNDKNKTVCQVLDECLKKRPCSQKCESSVGSHSCSCLEGYIPDGNGVCKANTSYPINIMFTNQYYIRLVNDTVNNGTLISQNLTNAVALDFHWDFGCIYWSDVTALGSSIKRSCTVTNRSEDIGKVEMNENVLHHSISSPDGIAVDWVAHNLYWCDKGTNTIEVSKLSGRHRKIIIAGLQDPRAIVLDPFRGYLYWTEWGDDPIIGKAGMDGTRVQTLISENLGWPNALTLSLETEEIWWADAKEDYIAVADLHGQNRKIVHSRAQNPSANLHHIFSLTTFEDTIYWSDWETKQISACHKYTGDNQRAITTKLIHRPMDVKAFHPYRQRPMLKNSCEDNPCQSLCLLSPDGGYICACPENFILNSDQTSCTANCTTSQFVCENTSKCIPKWWKCDGQPDCLDGEDEHESCPPFNCNPGHVQFENSTCLYPTSICDGTNDTYNGADEVDCDKYTCLSTHFKCHGNATVQSKCIPTQHRCDGNRDCFFGDDEDSCSPIKCPSTQFQCKTNGKCIQWEWVCDLENDCGDNSDENNCSNRTCSDDKYRCDSGKCIPKTWTCDSERDCSKGEDEIMSECEQPVTCEKNPSYYLCRNSHKCIPSRWKCDYEVDCPESDDELDCVPRNCSESEFKCGDGRCIHSRFVCDNLFECSDGSDETNCHASCNNLIEFQCVNPQTCLPTKFVCDGEFDCLDGSDEQDCGNSSRNCVDGFRCDKNNECIPSVWVCDGSVDCSEGEDEQICDKPIPTHPSLCSDTEFHCSDGNCINVSKVCNGKVDCEDDELGCPNCPFATCSQLCEKKKHDRAQHAFSCECVEGYLSEANTTRCSAKGDSATLIIASEDHLLRLNKPHDVDHVDLLISSTPTKVDSVDFFIDEDGSIKLFWSSRTNKAIQMMYITPDGNSVSSVRNRRSTSSTDIITGLDDPRGICIDWIAKVLFYIDAGHKTISASSLDGKNKMVILRRLTEPFDIAVDPISGRIFWSDYQSIEYAYEDGSGRKVIVHSLRPTGLAIDYPAQRLYFTDMRSLTIESTTLEGKDRQIVKRFPPGWLKPFKLDVFEDTLYFTNYTSNKILRLNKFGKNNVSDITYGVVKASDVVLIQQYKQISSKDYCAAVPCSSPGICLRTGSSEATCSCSSQKTGSYESPIVSECTSLKVACELKCKSEGKCMIDGTGRKFCKCQKGYSGPTCEKNSFDYNNENLPPGFNPNTTLVDLCVNMVCRNGGKCEVIEQIAYCRCPVSWVGINCEIEASFTNPCQGYCLHDGLCVLPYIDQQKECKCINGWNGFRCEQNPVCTNFYCFNGGTCMPNPDSRMLPTCKCAQGFYGLRCDRPDIQGKAWPSNEENGFTWVLVLVFILVALGVASFSGCVAYLVMRRKGRPFMHMRMQDSGTVEITNPMFLKDEGDEDHTSEPSLIFDSDKVLLQGTNFANPVYETMYKEGETSASNDEKKEKR